MLSFALISPRPSSRTPALARRITPDLTSVSALTVDLASSVFASTAPCRRSRLISANSSRKMLLKPRFGRRRCSGICPPSKPLMRTPERAVWPLPPRPAVLPLPEPMPRPTRMRFLREPALSASSLSFIVLSSSSSSSCPALRQASTPDRQGADGRDKPAMTAKKLFALDDADEVLNFGDHAAHGRGILQLGDTADLVEFEADQRRALRVMAADRAAGLLDPDCPCCLGHRHNSESCCYSATTSASPPTRRDCSVDTLMLRRAATERGES